MTEQEVISCEKLRGLLSEDPKLPAVSEKSVSLRVDNDCPEDLSWYRVSLIRDTMKGIYEGCGWTVSECDADLSVLLTLNTVPAKGQEQELGQRAVIGVVRNIATKQKEKDTSTEEYIRMREADILSTEGNKELAKATVDFELLHVGFASCVNLDFDPQPLINRGSSSRGVVFCLYNFARIATILNKHESGVAKGEYPPLPPLDEEAVETLLGMKPEMQLVKDCLLRFPKVLCAVAPVEKTRLPQPHLLCRFLSEISHPISRYYRSHHVLTESSAHLLPVMHARIYLLKAIHRILLYTFKLIGLQPQETM